MIGIYKEKLNAIPALIVLDNTKENEPLPTVTYFHGFTSAKEQNLSLAYLLAEKGFRVVLPDSDHHGERDRGANDVQKQLAFWNIVLQNINELEQIKSYLSHKNLILNDQFGVAGTSMGGITTSAALTAYPWIKAGAILMGSPRITTYANTLINAFKEKYELPISDDQIHELYKQLMHYDLSKQPEKLVNRPLLFWHGENDPVVPFDHSYSFYNETVKYYKNPEHIHFISEQNRDHKVSRFAMLETVKWFEQHLNSRLTTKSDQ